MSIKTQLLELLDQSYQEEQAFLASLTDAERAAQGSHENWSAKDILAHITAWKDHMAHYLSAAARGEKPESIDDIDAANAQFYQVYAQDTWEAITAKAERAHQDLKISVESLSDAALSDPNHFSWQEGRPLWRSAIGDGYSHPLSHLAQFYATHGDRARADRLEEQMVAQLNALDGSPNAQGINLYNLACYYALSGQKDKALAALQHALQLKPDLAGYSRQDVDFTSLRNDPDFLRVTETTAS